MVTLDGDRNEMNSIYLTHSLTSACYFSDLSAPLFIYTIPPYFQSQQTLCHTHSPYFYPMKVNFLGYRANYVLLRTFEGSLFFPEASPNTALYGVGMLGWHSASMSYVCLPKLQRMESQYYFSQTLYSWICVMQISFCQLAHAHVNQRAEEGETNFTLLLQQAGSCRYGTYLQQSQNRARLPGCGEAVPVTAVIGLSSQPFQRFCQDTYSPH